MMDITVYDYSFTPYMVIDEYESLIWTDRYYEAGDFQLEIYATSELLTNIKVDQYLSVAESDRMMIIEKVEVHTDVETGTKMTLSGRSLESILDRRVVWGTLKYGTSQEESDAKVVDVIEDVMNKCIISPDNSKRTLPFYFDKPTSDTPSGTIINSFTITSQYTGATVYDVMLSICKECEMGFKVTRDFINNRFVLSLYLGVDHSLANKDNNPYVIFSPNFENLIDSNYYESVQAFKNVAFITGPQMDDGTYTYTGAYVADDYVNETYNFSDVSGHNYLRSSEHKGKIPALTVGNKYTVKFDGVEYKDLTAGMTWTPGTSIVVFYYIGDPNIINYGTSPTYPFCYVWTSGLESVIESDAWYVPTSSSRSHTISMTNPNSEPEGLLRRETYVDGGGTNSEDVSADEYLKMLQTKGIDELNNLDIQTAIDGSIDTTGSFRYGEDFSDGDIVQIEDMYGHKTTVRILEMIISDDGDNTRNFYPTFKEINKN